MKEWGEKFTEDETLDAGSGPRRSYRALRNDEVEVTGVLGQGGMASVLRARQIHLDREVAVKRPHDGSGSSELAVLREARVMARLEHPAIVPIYEVREEPDGTPVVFMRRISGHTWREVLDSPEMISDVFGRNDHLRWNLEIFSRLCEVVSFAHEQGIVHRDLKPENVMLGTHGELYLIDWGIALSTNEADRGLLPLASDAKDLAGTPAYMAPEMVFRDREISTRTDVYLLGAIFLELVTGERRRRANSIAELRVEVLEKPSFPESVPSMVIDICLQALSIEPNERYASASELLKALRDYKNRNQLNNVIAATSLRVEELRRRFLAEEHHPEDDEMLLELRAGLKEIPPEDPALPVLRDAIRELRVLSYLLSDDINSASRVFSKIQNPSAVLKAQVSRAREAAERGHRKVESLARFERNRNVRIGKRARLATLSALGIVWAIGPLVDAFTPQAGYWAYTGPAIVGLVISVLAATLAVKKNDALVTTSVGRQTAVAFLMLCGAVLTVRIFGYVLGLSLEDLGVIQMLCVSEIVCMYVLAVDRRLWLASVVYFVLTIAAAVEPSWVEGLRFIANTVCLGLVVQVLRKNPTLEKNQRESLPSPD